MIVNHCGSCGFYRTIQPNTKACILDNIQHPADYYCGSYANQVEACDTCGRIIIDKKGIIVTDRNGRYMLICSDCYNSLGTCSTCVNTQCGLQADTSGRPKQVQRKVQSGGMVMVAPGPNPELVQEYCTTCLCYMGGSCQRQKSGSCSNYNSVIS